MRNQQYPLSIGNDEQNITKEKILKIFSQYKYNNQMAIVDGYLETDLLAAVIFRPGLREFLTTLKQLINQGQAKEIIIFTANVGQYAKTLVDTINKYCGTSLSLYDKQPKHPDSIVVDDSSNVARSKVAKAKIASFKDAGSRHVLIPKFKGDLSDRELYNIIDDIKAKL